MNRVLWVRGNGTYEWGDAPEEDVQREAMGRATHYDDPASPTAPIKVIEAWGLNFSLGNVVKYVARAGKKGPALEDLEKARFYLQREIARLKNETKA